MKRGAPAVTGIAFGGLVALAAAMGIGRFVYTPILPFMAAGLGLTKSAAGLIASANFLGYLVGALAAAATALPGGRRAWFLAALALSALSTAAMALGTSLPCFLALRFVGGIASAFVLVFASALVLDRLAAAGRPGLAALHFAGVGCGIALSAVLVAGLAAGGYDWRAQWLASGALSLVALVLVIRLIPPAEDVQPAAAPAARQRLDRRLLALVVAYGLFGFGYVITATFISTIVRADAALRPIEPIVWLVVGVAAAPSVALWAWIGRGLGNDRSFAIACLVEAAGVAMSVLATSAAAVIAAAALLGGTIMGITALGLVHARSLARGDPRRTLALMTASFGLGQMLGPTLAGYAFELTGSFRPSSLAAAAALAIAAGLVMVARVRRPA
ncbi:MAG TPA: YbfB/YjiJ family MFS transporter [Methylomirabilota bacterium]|nr:YbfB/YjiJ family MFS transporter [Methylomirabilota bacterium]